jgi:hypothetical protein
MSLYRFDILIDRSCLKVLIMMAIRGLYDDLGKKLPHNCYLPIAIAE